MEIKIDDKRQEYIKSAPMKVKNKIKLTYIAYLTPTELNKIFERVFNSTEFAKTKEQIETMQYEFNNNNEIELNASYKKERGKQFIGKKILAKLSDFESYVYADLDENLAKNQSIKNEIKIDYVGKMMKKFVDYPTKARTYFASKPATDSNKKIVKMLDDYIYRYNLSSNVAI